LHRSHAPTKIWWRPDALRFSVTQCNDFAFKDAIDAIGDQGLTAQETGNSSHFLRNANINKPIPPLQKNPINGM
jgi:hypothetical protein